MARIRIIATPAGEAPEWVRQAWVGLELPIQSCEGFGTVTGVLTPNPSSENLGGHHVNERIAVDMLRAKDFGAALWWEENVDIQPNKCFVFGKRFCILLS